MRVYAGGLLDGIKEGEQRNSKEIRKKKRKKRKESRIFSKLGRRKLTTPKKQRAEHSETTTDADMRYLGLD